MTNKNIIYDILNFDPLIPTNILSQLVPKIPQHAPGHSARLHPIGSLRPSLRHLWMAQRRFHQKRTSLWIWCPQNRHPIGSLSKSLHHLQFLLRKCPRRRPSMWMWRRQNHCPIVSLRSSIHHIRFAQRRYHLIKDPIMNLPPPESWPKIPADWAVT